MRKARRVPRFGPDRAGPERHRGRDGARPPSGRNITHFRLYRSNTTNTSADVPYVPCPIRGRRTAGRSARSRSPTTRRRPSCRSRAPRCCGTSRRRTFAAWWAEPTAAWPAFGQRLLPVRAVRAVRLPGGSAHHDRVADRGAGLCSEQTYFVGTRGRPYLMSGADTQSLIAIEARRGSAVRGETRNRRDARRLRVPSPDGLCFCSLTGAVKVITGPEGFNLFDRESWQALVPSSIIAAEYEGAYVFHWDNGTTSGSVHARHRQRQAGVDDGYRFGVLLRDSITDRLPYAASGTRDQRAVRIGHEAHGAVEARRSWQLDSYPSFSWLQAQSKYESGGTITVNLYGDGDLIQTEDI
jgi:hypothetical protein